MIALLEPLSKNCQSDKNKELMHAFPPESHVFGSLVEKTIVSQILVHFPTDWVNWGCHFLSIGFLIYKRL